MFFLSKRGATSNQRETVLRSLDPDQDASAAGVFTQRITFDRQLLQLHVHFRAIQCNVRSGSSKLIIGVVRKVESVAVSCDFRTVYGNTKTVANGHKPFRGPVKIVNGRVFLRQHCTNVLNHLISDEARPGND